MGDMSIQSREPPRGATYEEVWALIRENAREFKEMREEAKQERIKAKQEREEAKQEQKKARQEREEARQEQKKARQEREEARQEQKEVTRQIKTLNAEVAQLQKETARQMKETDRRLGELGLRLGDVVEHIMSPKLHEKFETLNFRFSRSSRNVEIRDQNRRQLTEVDVLLENGDYVIAVEVKTRPASRDIKDHIKRMEILRRVADEHDDKRKYLGAIAGAVVTPEVLAYALKNGFYVIVPSGDTVNIEAPEGFNPRIW